MPFEKGHEKKGGRKKGTTNKKSRYVQEKSDELGVEPFVILLHIANGNSDALNYPEFINLDQRLQAAKECCSYLYSKKRSIEIKTDEMDLPDRFFAFPDPKKK